MSVSLRWTRFFTISSRTGSSLFRLKKATETSFPIHNSTTFHKIPAISLVLTRTGCTLNIDSLTLGQGICKVPALHPTSIKVYLVPHASGSLRYIPNDVELRLTNTQNRHIVTLAIYSRHAMRAMVILSIILHRRRQAVFFRASRIVDENNSKPTAVEV